MISRDHRALFVHVPKCAGQAVETAFLNALGLTWETRAPLLLRPNDDPAAGPPRLAHLTAADYVRCGHVTAEEFDSFFTFAIIRDPWTRTVSLYRHLEPNLGFHDWVTGWLDDTIVNERDDFWFVRPEADFLCGPDGVMVDKVLRFETIAEDFAPVARRFGLDPVLPRVNRSGARTAPDKTRKRSLIGRVSRAVKKALTPDRFERDLDPGTCYDPATRDTVRRVYAKDFALFGYDPEAA